MPTIRAPSVPPERADSWAVAGADGLPVRAYAWRTNRGGRPALLWGHANGFAAGAYARLLDRLADAFDIFAADLRAHGGSADPGGDYDRAMSADRLALDLAAIVQSVRRRAPTQPMHFAAHSASGLAALRLGAVHGLSPFRSMTLFEPPLAPTPDHPLHAGAAALGETLAQRALRRRKDLPDPDAFAANLAARDGFGRWDREMLRDYAHATLAPTEAATDGAGEGASSAVWRLRCPAEAEAAVYRMTMDVSTFAALGRFDRPVIFVESDPDMDGVAPSWATKAQAAAAARAPQGALARIARTSHMMPFERPDAVVEAVRGTVANS